MKRSKLIKMACKVTGRCFLRSIWSHKKKNLPFLKWLPSLRPASRLGTARDKPSDEDADREAEGRKPAPVWVETDEEVEGGGEGEGSCGHHSSFCTSAWLRHDQRPRTKMERWRRSRWHFLFFSSWESRGKTPFGNRSTKDMVMYLCPFWTWCWITDGLPLF